jgi:hypothetical protein
MHNAPSVIYPVGRPVLAGVLAAVLWGGGAILIFYWWLQADIAGWRQAGAALAVAATGAWALLSWLRSPAGEIHWDGSGWSGPQDGGSGSMALALDLQQWLLVRWQGADSARWLWLERRRCPERWSDLRRAVYSRARTQSLPPAKPPAATP